MSTYSVNNIEVHRHGKDLYLIVSFISGQVSLFKSIDQHFLITQNPRKDSYSIQMMPVPEKPLLLDFEFISQINNHFEIHDPRIFQSVKIAPYEGPLDTPLF